MEMLLSFFITIAANTILGLIVFFRAPKEANNIRFAIFCMSIVSWIGSLFLYYKISAQPWLLWLGRFNLACGGFVPLAAFLFICTFPKKIVVIPRWFVLGVAALSLLFCLLCYTPLIDISEMAQGANRSTIFGPLYPLFLAEIALVCFLSIGVLIVKRRRAVGITRIQLLYFAMGFISLFVIAMYFNGILPYFFHNYNYQSFGSLASVGFIGFTTYAIIHHRFFDINRIIAYTLRQISLLATLGVIYAAITFGIGMLFFPRYVNAEFILISMGACLVLRTFFLDPFTKYAERITWVFSLTRLYTKEKIAATIHDMIQTKVELDSLIFSVLTMLTREMKISWISYIALPEKNIAYSWSIPQKRKRPFTHKQGKELLSNIKQIILTEELNEGKLKQYLVSQKIALAFPLQIGPSYVCLLLCGEKQNKDPYFYYDIQTLRLISQPLIIAIQNAQYLHQIHSYNNALSYEVKKATRELLRVNSQLRQADSLKDEFISIASHELKTPTTAIQGFLWLVLQKDRDLSRYSRDKIERVAKLTQQLTILVNDMLDVSKIESKRINLHPEIFDIGQLIEEIKGEMSIFALEKNIDIQIKHNKPYKVWADKQRAHQIVSNLMNNALKYTPGEGKVAISLKKKDSKVEVSVRDTGIGIRNEDMPKLFTKFGKLENGNSISSHLPGTGLGLYITKHFVELSGGDIDVESTYGLGSTFTFSLPAKEHIPQ